MKYIYIKIENVDIVRLFFINRILLLQVLITVIIYAIFKNVNILLKLLVRKNYHVAIHVSELMVKYNVYLVWINNVNLLIKAKKVVIIVTYVGQKL